MRWQFLTAEIPLGKKYRFRFPELFWFLMAIAAVFSEYFFQSINNYHIFKGVFWHTIEQSNLYAEYPSEYFDRNHYGPFFSIIIAPFALLPDGVGVFAWCIANALVLYIAIKKLPLTTNAKMAVLGISVLEMTTSIHSVQFNPMLAGWLVLAFVLTEKRNDFWACLFIAAGFMVKIYGVAGLLFFVFSKNKLKFILSFLFWSAILFVLPMVLSSPSFILQSYQDWADVLIEKNAKNMDFLSGSTMQDISATGMIRRIFRISDSIDLWVLVPAFFMITLPLLRFNQYKYLGYRLSYLAIVLISVVIFSSSAESATYVLAVTGIAIWFITYPINGWTIGFLIFMLLLTCLSPTDLFPKYVRSHYIRAYSLKALPCVLIWGLLIWNVSFRNFKFMNIPYLK